MRLCKNVRKQLCRSVEQNREFNFSSAIHSPIITEGMRYCLGTGNWGGDRAAPARTGVSVCVCLCVCSTCFGDGASRMLLCVAVCVFKSVISLTERENICACRSELMHE